MNYKQGGFILWGGKEHNGQEKDKYSSVENISENICLQQKCNNNSKPITTFCDKL